MTDQLQNKVQSAKVTLWNFAEPAVTVIAATLPVLRVPALALIRKLRGQNSTTGGGTSHSQHHNNNGYIRSMAGRHSGEWPLRESSGASERSLGDIVVKQDFILQTESVDLAEIKSIKQTYKPC